MPSLKSVFLTAMAVMGAVSMPLAAVDERNEFDEGFNATSLLDKRYVTPNSVGTLIDERMI